jgi:hypothetical protein
MGLWQVLTNMNKKPVTAPAKESINYKSVLNYLLGLSDEDFAKLHKILEIYREADKKIIKMFGLTDMSTSKLFDVATEDLIDSKLDEMLLKDGIQAAGTGMSYELSGKKPASKTYWTNTPVKAKAKK